MIHLLVFAHYARRFCIWLLSPLEGFVRAMKDQMRKERNSNGTACSSKMSTGKSGTASDCLTPTTLTVKNADDLEKGRDRTPDLHKGVKPLYGSIVLYLGIWLTILHFTWPNVDLSENTSIFIYGACMSPRWGATAFSMYALACVFPLGESFWRRIPNIQDLQDRSATELSNYFIQATVVITATILTVDIQWMAISVFYTGYLELPPYQAGNSEVKLRWLRDAILVLVLYPVATTVSALAWQPLYYFRETVWHYNERLDLLYKQVNQAHVGGNSHDAPCLPAKFDAEKEEGRENQQSAKSNARKEEEERSEDHDGGGALPIASVKNLVRNDWDLVEEDLHSKDASNAPATASATLHVSSDEGNCH